MVPVPQVASWEALNLFLLEASRNDEQRLIGERAQMAKQDSKHKHALRRKIN